jgi:hypothetical protein
VKADYKTMTLAELTAAAQMAHKDLLDALTERDGYTLHRLSVRLGHIHSVIAGRYREITHDTLDRPLTGDQWRALGEKLRCNQP